MYEWFYSICIVHIHLKVPLTKNILEKRFQKQCAGKTYLMEFNTRDSLQPLYSDLEIIFGLCQGAENLCSDFCN